MMAVLSLEVVMRQRPIAAGETSRQPRMTVLPKMMSGSPENMHPLVALETVTGLRLLVRVSSVRLAISNHLTSAGDVLSNGGVAECCKRRGEVLYVRTSPLLTSEEYQRYSP